MDNPWIIYAAIYEVVPFVNPSPKPWKGIKWGFCSHIGHWMFLTEEDRIHNMRLSRSPDSTAWARCICLPRCRMPVPMTCFTCIQSDILLAVCRSKQSTATSPHTLTELWTCMCTHVEAELVPIEVLCNAACHDTPQLCLVGCPDWLRCLQLVKGIAVVVMATQMREKL